MKKKITAAIMTALFLVGATVAYAQPKQGADGGKRFGSEKGRRGPAKEMSAEDKADREQMQKLQKELHEELGKENPDKAKATKLFDNILDLRQKGKAKRFDRMLNNPRGPREQGNRRGGKMSEQEHAKMAELRETRNQLSAEMHKENPDKTKAKQLFDKAGRLKKELEKSRFEKMLNDPDRKNRKDKRPEMSPATKAKFEQMREIDKQFRAEAEKENPNKDTLRSLHKQKQSIKNSIDDERFENMLNNPNGFKMKRGGPGPDGHDRGGRPEMRGEHGFGERGEFGPRGGHDGGMNDFLDGGQEQAELL